MIQSHIVASQVALVVKNLPANAGDVRHGFDPWVRKIPWRRWWKPTPVFLLKNPMEREVWWTTVHGVTKSQTWHCLSHLKGACKFFLKRLHHEYLGLWAIWSLSQQLISITVVRKQSQKMGNKWMWLCSNKTLLNKTGSPACPQAEVCWSLTDLWSVGRLWQREIRGSETTKPFQLWQRDSLLIYENMTLVFWSLSNLSPSTQRHIPTMTPGKSSCVA